MLCGLADLETMKTHKRERVWNLKAIQSEWKQFIPESWKAFDAEAWLCKSPVARVNDGLSVRVDRNKSMGNAIVPHVIYPVLRLIHDRY